MDNARLLGGNRALSILYICVMYSVAVGAGVQEMPAEKIIPQERPFLERGAQFQVQAEVFQSAAGITAYNRNAVKMAF